MIMSYIIGASLSEPHTILAREFGAEISIVCCLLACLLVSVGFRARIRGKMFAWSSQNNCSKKSQVRYREMTCFFFLPKIFFLQCTRMRISCQCKCSILYEAGVAGICVSPQIWVSPTHIPRDICSPTN